MSPVCFRSEEEGNVTLMSLVMCQEFLVGILSPLQANISTLPSSFPRPSPFS